MADQRSNIDRLAEEFAALFQRATERIITKLSTRDIGRMSAAERLRLVAEIESILGGLNDSARRWIEQYITDMYERAQAETLVAVGAYESVRAALEALRASGAVNASLLDFLKRDMMDDVLSATNRMSAEAKQIVRQAVSDTFQQAVENGNVATKTTRRDMADRLNRLQAAVIDSAGRRWSNEVYADMLARTKLAEAHRNATVEQASSLGYDLARISVHNAVDACSHFEGAIISLTGKTPGYPTLAELKNSGLIFHPRCRHLAIPINPDSLSAANQRLAEEKAQQAADALQLAQEGKMNSHGLKKSAQ